MVFAGPSPESIEAFGLKHTARELATKAGVPIVPGTNDLVKSEDEAVEAAKNLGFPVLTQQILSFELMLITFRLCSRLPLVVAEWAC